MTNINLYQSSQLSSQKAKKNFVDVAILAVAVVFLLVLVAYFGSVYYLRSLGQEIELSKAEEARGKASLNSKEVNTAASFQQRLEKMASDKEALENKNPGIIFGNLQSSVIQGAVVSQVGVDGSSVSLSFIADNFEIVAKQVASFKRSGFFRDIEVGTTNRGEDGKVNVDLNMSLAM